MLKICFWCLDMENEIVIHNENDLWSKIYTIRGMRVMLDFDLAEIYGYETKNFNRQVKNNIEKFDEDFMFQLNYDEVLELSRCKNCTSIQIQVKGIKGGRAYLPYAFTEQGIYMLMTVLRGDLAIKQSKILIRLFKTMKDFIIERENLIGSDEVARLAIQTSQNTKDIAENTKDIARIDQKLSEISRKIHNFSPIEISKNLLCLDERTVEANKDCPQLDIESKILVIRGQQVMIDRDLAELYGVETKVLNQAVKRNIERFPPDFLFVLNNIEKEELVTICDRFSPLKHSSSNPYAFTEHGIAMLSSVLRSPNAVEVNIRIMRAFVALRRFVKNNSKIFTEIDSIKKHQLEHDIHFSESDRKIDELFDKMDRYKIEDKQGIFFQGQIFDAYAKFESFIAEAEKEIVLIDNYVDLTVLERFAQKKIGVKVRIYTYPKTKITTLDIQKFNEQYPTLELKYTEKIHDRFLIIDGKILYHIGASLKDLGKKCFAFEILDPSWIAEILRNL